MAEVSLSSTIERDILTCQICMEIFSTPKILPCLHTFCSGCVEHSIITTGCEGESHFSIKCPICRATTYITSAHAECLKTNFYTNSLVEVFRAKSAKTVPCSICHMKGKQTTAKCKCIECGDFLCKSCGNIHTFSKQTIHHTIITMDELASDKYDVQLRDAQNVFCEDHKDEIVTFYCNTCVQPVCRDCIMLDHKSHDCVKGEHAMREIKPHLYKIITLQDQNSLESQERQTQLENELQSIRTEKQTAINTIHNFLAALITRISEEGDAVIDALVQSFDLAEKHIYEQRDRIKTNLQLINDSQRFCTSVLEHGKAIDVLSLHSELKNRLKILQTIDTEAKCANTIVKYPVIKQDKLVSNDKFNLIYTETSNSSSPTGKMDPFVIWTKSAGTVVDDGNDRKEQRDQKDTATPGEIIDEALEREPITPTVLVYHNEGAPTRDVSVESLPPREKVNTEQVDQGEKANETGNNTLITNSDNGCTQKKQTYQTEKIKHEEKATTRQTTDVSIPLKAEYNAEQNDELEKATKRENSDKGFTQEQNKDQTENTHNNEKATTREYSDVSISRGENDDTEQNDEIRKTNKKENSDNVFTQTIQTDQMEKISHKDKATIRESSEETNKKRNRRLVAKRKNNDKEFMKKQQTDQKEQVHNIEKAITRETLKVPIPRSENDKIEQKEEIGLATKRQNSNVGFTQKQHKDQQEKIHLTEKATTKETSEASISWEEKSQKPQIHQTEQVGQNQKCFTMGTSDKLLALNGKDKTDQMDQRKKADATTDKSKPQNGASDQLDRKEKVTIARNRRKALTPKESDQAEQVDKRVKATTKATSDKSISQKETDEHENAAIRETRENVPRRSKQQGGYFIRNAVKTSIVGKHSVCSNSEKSTNSPNTTSSDIGIHYHNSFCIRLHEDKKIPIITAMVVTNSNTVMLADETNRCVKEFYIDGSPLRSFRNIQMTPLRMDIGDERLAVSDNNSMCTMQTSDEQNMSRSLFGSDIDRFPIVFDKTRPDIIAIGNLKGNYRIPITFVNMKGKIMSNILTKVAVLPIFMGQNSEGDLIISDWAANCVRIVTRLGCIKAEYSPEFTKKEKERYMTTKFYSCFWRPGDIAVGEDDTIYVCDMFRSRIILLDKSANLVAEVDLNTFGIIQPRSVCVVADGTLCVAYENTHVAVLKVKHGH